MHARGGRLISFMHTARFRACTSLKVFYPGGAQDDLLASSRGLVITLPGDPNNVNKELPQTVDTDVLPPCPLSPGGAWGVKHIAIVIRRLTG